MIPHRGKINPFFVGANNHLEDLFQHLIYYFFVFPRFFLQKKPTKIARLCSPACSLGQEHPGTHRVQETSAPLHALVRGRPAYYEATLRCATVAPCMPLCTNARDGRGTMRRTQPCTSFVRTRGVQVVRPAPTPQRIAGCLEG